MPMTRSRLLYGLLVFAFVPSFACAQQTVKSAQPAVSASSPEIDRLAKALGGDWNTAESMEKSEFFPNGGSRHGRAHIRLVAGGTSLFAEFHSDGSAGKLDGLYVIWWDKPANIYRFFDCFNHITSTSHSLVAAVDAGDGTMKTLITTTSTRR